MGRHDRSAPNDAHTRQAAAPQQSRTNAENYHRRARNRRMKGVLRGVLIALLVLLAGGVAVGATTLFLLQGRMNDSRVVNDDLRRALVERKAPNEPYYMLLMGTDGRPGETQYRADSIILARVDPLKKQVTLLSIPRDTKIVWHGSTMKINGVHTYAGAAGMVEVVSELCGVDIAHYAEVNFDGLAGITDALGGVTVNVDRDMRDTDNFEGVTELKAGEQTLDGESALFYTRCRHFPDGDYTRMLHQRTFIRALMNQVLSTRDPVRVAGVIQSCADMVITDLSVTDIIAYATELMGINAETDVYSAHVPSEPRMIDGVSYIIIDQTKLAELMKIMEAGGDPATVDPLQSSSSATTGSAENSGQAASTSQHE